MLLQIAFTIWSFYWSKHWNYPAADKTTAFRKMEEIQKPVCDDSMYTQNRQNVSKVVF